MKIWELIKFSFDEMVKKFGQWFLFFLANCVAVTLLILTVFMVKMIEVNQDDFKALFKQDIGKYGVVSIGLQSGGQYTADEYAPEDCLKCYEEIKDKLKDKFVDFYYEDNSSAITNFDEKTENIIQESDRLEKERLGLVYYTETVFDEFDIRFKKTETANANNYPVLYLGSAWGDSLLGKIVELDGTKYFVGAILEEDSKIPNKEVWNSRIAELNAENNLNDAVINVYRTEDYVRENSMGILSMQFRYEGDFDEMEKELEGIFYKYKGYVNVTRLEDSVYSALIPFKSLRNMCIIFVIVTFVTIELIYSINQFLYVLNDKEDMGIFYSNGASVRDLIRIQFFKTIFQILGSFVVALAGSSLLAYSLGNGGSVVFKEAVYKILFCRTYPPVFIITALFGIVLSIVPVICISQNKPADLIR